MFDGLYYKNTADLTVGDQYYLVQVGMIRPVTLAKIYEDDEFGLGERIVLMHNDSGFVDDRYWDDTWAWGLNYLVDSKEIANQIVSSKEYRALLKQHNDQCARDEEMFDREFSSEYYDY